MRLCFVVLPFIGLLAPVSPQAVNPCVALKLPLCKLKTGFATSIGIRTTKPTTTKRPDGPGPSFVARRPDAPMPNVSRRPEPPRPNFSSGGDCKGLRFCVLRKDVQGGQSRRPPPRPPTVPRITIVTPSPVSSDSESLMSAVLNGRIDTAKARIADGADVNSADVHGNSVLHIAAQNGRAGIIDDLLLNGADVNGGNSHNNVALHLAAQNGWTEVAAKLLRAIKIRVNAVDLHANTALHLAAQNGQIGVTQLLIDRPEIEINKPNSHGLIPLHLAAQNGHLELSRMLVAAGSNLDYPDLIGNTPLHTAVHTNHRNIANLLVQAGADERKKNKSGLTAFQLGK